MATLFKTAHSEFPSWRSGNGVAVSCGVGRRCGLDCALLWLWQRLVATAVIHPIAWEPPCAAGAALEKKTQKKKGALHLGLHPILPAFSYHHLILNVFYLFIFRLHP